MESTLKYTILDYLRSGNARSIEYNLELTKSWGSEGVDLLKQISEGSLEVENPKIRLRSFYVLGKLMDPKNFKMLMSDLISKDPDQRLRFEAFNALATSSVLEAASLASELIEKVDENPALALAAARVLAHTKGKEAIPAIEKIKESIFQMAGENKNSPSYLSLQLLLEEVQGKRKAKTENIKKEV